MLYMHPYSEQVLENTTESHLVASKCKSALKPRAD